MKWKRKLSAFMIMILFATMILRYDLIVRAEADQPTVGVEETNAVLPDGTETTPSDGNPDETSDKNGNLPFHQDGVIYINSFAELAAAVEAMNAQAGSGEASAFPEDYVPSEEELDAMHQSTSTGSNAMRRAAPGKSATGSDATDSNALMRQPFSISEMIFTQSMMEDFNNGTSTMPLPVVAAGDTLVVKNTASGHYISKGYEHFTMVGAGSGTYIFEDFELWGGGDSSSKGKGGIKASGGTVNLKHMSFRNFKSKAVSGTGELQVADSEFIGFSDSSVISDNNVTIDNSLFLDCHLAAGHGSAIQIGTKLTMSDTTMIDCGGGSTVIGGYTAGAIGGIGGNKTLTISNCYFTENHGNLYGGAISLYQFGGTVKITDSYFAGNSVSHSVAASGNKADGGAVGVFNNGQVLALTVDGCTFAENVAMDDAGALFVESAHLDPKIDVEVKNSTFAENVAQRYDSLGTGGAVQLSLNVTAEFINNTFTGNICENPGTNQKGSGAAVGSHYGRISGLNFRGPVITFKNNLFVGNSGKPYSATSNRQINVGGTMTQTDGGGNIGYDFSAVPDTDLSLESVYGVSSVSIAENGSSIEAGCNIITASGDVYSPVAVPTYWIAPAITDDSGNIINALIHADNAVAANEYDYDQRGMTRVDDDDSDAGAVEMISAKFDANLGSWASGGTYTYEDPLLYVKKLAADAEYSYVYSAADPGTSSVEVPSDPARDTYILKGWTLTKDGDDFVENTAGFTPGRTYYAKWAPVVRLDLTYHLNDSSGTAIVDPDGDYLENTAVTVKSLTDFSWTAPADCYFTGWAAASAPTPADPRYQPGDTFTVTGTGQNLYAQWQEHYQLSYGPGADPAEVTGMPIQPADKIDKGQIINLAVETPGRPGWTFDGWQSDISGDTTVYHPGQAFTMPGQNVVLTATWTRNHDLDLIYHLNDGTGLTKADPDGSYLEHTPVKVKSLADLSWSIPAGQRFRGWSTKQNPSETDQLYQSGDTYTLGNSSGHLYAQWVKFYTVTFESHGGNVVETIRNIEGGSLIEQPYVRRSGYTFQGWYTDNGTFRNEWNFKNDKVTADMTLHASWSRNTGGGGDGGGSDPGPKPTDPQPTEPAVTEPQPTEPPVTEPQPTEPAATVPSRPLPELPPGYYVREENNILMVYSPEGVPLGYLAANDMSGTIYPLSMLPKTGDGQTAGKNRLLYLMLISAGGLLSLGGVFMKRRQEEQE